MRKQIGNGKVLLINGNPGFKSSYKQIVFNSYFIGMAKSVLFNVVVNTKDNLPIPGGEAGINLDISMYAYNFYDADMENFKLYLWLPNFIEFIEMPEFCVADNNTYSRFEYLSKITTLNLSTLVVCSKEVLTKFEKLELKTKINIID